MSVIKISEDCARDINYIFRISHSSSEYDLIKSNNIFLIDERDQEEITSELIDKAMSDHVFSEEFLRLFADKL